MNEPTPQAPPSKEELWVTERIRAFYKAKPPCPSEVSRREFGFGFQKKIDYRHKAFNGCEALRDFLVRETPRYVSCSAAYYDLPGARPMERKGYRGADLVFDLDTSYAHELHEHLELVCPYCLNRVKQDAQQLVEEFLVKDFGLSSQEIWVNYSGSKGFHIHMQSQPVRELSAEARRQLLGYLTGEGVSLERILVKKQLGQGRFKLAGPTKASRGWPRKLYNTAHAFLEKCTVKDLTERGARKVDANKIVENRAFLLKQVEEGNWDAMPGLRKVWANLLEAAKKLRGLEVDQGVTFDLARILRLEDSIHGDTGLVAKKAGGASELEKFDPLKHALSANPKQFASVVPNSDLKFQLMEQTFELKANEKVEVPDPVALLLLCKKRATLA